MEKFAAYGFNKSHAAAYGFLTYVTAFLKANYPKEWMAALMTCDRDDLSKVSKFIRECQSMGIAMLPPDVNEAGAAFTATPKGIRFAMTGIKGVGAGVVEAIIQERTKGGPFTSLYQFFKRIDTKKVGKKVVESMVGAGCFDFTQWSRDALRESIDPVYEAASKEQKETASGIISLFSLMEDSQKERFTKEPKAVLSLSKRETLLKEKELLGFFLTGHPMDGYRDILKRLSCIRISKLDTLEHDAVFRTAFIVESVQVRISSKSQKKFAILMISDGMESYELPIWSELYEEKGSLLRENQLLYAVLQVDKKEEVRLSCRWLDDLTQVNEPMIEACDQAYDKAKQQAQRYSQMKNNPKPPKAPMKTLDKPEQTKPQHLIIKADLETLRLSHLLQIRELFDKHRGQTPVKMHFHSYSQEVATLHIDNRWGVIVSDALRSELSRFPGISI
jgi:DNA polymerase III subunit alpha